MAKKKTDTISIGFEDKIWKAADVLRGNLNAAEYEGVVLGLIFLKYISDKFEEKYQELEQDEYADKEDKDEYTADMNIAIRGLEANLGKSFADTFHKFQQGTLEDEKGFCAVVSTEDIKKQDYILTPGRYVGIAEDAGDGEPFAEKMERLTASLSQLFNESREQEEEIRKQLKSIGWEV